MSTGSSVPVVTRVRSMLFMPGNQPAMIAKIPRFAPDIAVVDLEDAVAPADKIAARATAVAAIDALDPAGTLVLVRVNPVGAEWFEDDVAAAARSAAAGVVLPKLERVEDLVVLRVALEAANWGDAVVIGGIETVLGVADARELLGLGLSAAFFGAEDYIADIGGRRTPGGDEVLYARSQVCLAAFLAGIPAIDQVVTDFGDDDRFRVDAAAAVAIGYQGKMCIHPRQVELAHEAFTPTAAEVQHAEAVLAAADQGVAVIDGQMIDDVHVRMARTVLARLPDRP
jgi:citrate lyase subunit beta/citryl-CoA lyase